jgi:uncharacterized heparinase superfamily protein
MAVRSRRGGWVEPISFVPDALKTPCRLRDYMVNYHHGATLEPILEWIERNPPGAGAAWEPYPLSLRVVNWIKWLLAGGDAKPRILSSLAMQVEYLSRRVEWHLLGNHLLANAKALAFGGVFFAWPRLLSQAGQLLSAQLAEQVLSDGAHFERTPMYHCAALEDVLDLVNLGRAYPGTLPELAEIAERMLAWLEHMCHPDGRIAFFNDATFGAAPEPADLARYASRLGLRAAAVPLGESKFVRLENEAAVVLFDVGGPSPRYQPGHSHAEALSFELSIGGRRVIVNRGISTYQDCAERRRQRGTAAHSTVCVDGKDQSEVWSSFRVGARARTFDISTDGSSTAAASHDGYAQCGAGNVVHRRTLLLHRESLEVTDRIEGSGRHRVEIWFHAHPEASPSIHWDARVSPETAGSRYHTGFDRSGEATSYVGRWTGNCPVEFTNRILFSPTDAQRSENPQ